MIINIEDPNPAIKVYFDKEGRKEAYVMLRPATSEVLSNIRKETHVRRFKNIKGSIHEYFDIDESLYDFKLWEYCMPGWGNIKDEKGNDIIYSPEKACFLLKNSPYFSNQVGEKMEELTEIMEKRAKVVEKN